MEPSITKRPFAAILCLLLVACSPNHLPETGHLQPLSATPLPTLIVDQTKKPLFNHIIVVMMENLDYTKAIELPYLKELMQRYAYTQNYSGITHPSLPNHIGTISGEIYRFSDECSPGVDCHIPGTGKNIADLLESAGYSWKAYMEGMPKACALQNEQKYAVHHNPFLYFDSIRNDPVRCDTHDVPYEEFQADLNSGNLPNFIWITPDLCNGMHTKCGLFTSRMQQGERWLQKFVPAVLESPQFKDDGLLVITFDEGNGTAGCCGAPGGGKILTLLISNTTFVKSGGWASDIPYNHFSLLRMLEDNWGLPHLGHSDDPGIAPMSDFFNQTK